MRRGLRLTERAPPAPSPPLNLAADPSSLRSFSSSRKGGPQEVGTGGGPSRRREVDVRALGAGGARWMWGLSVMEARCGEWVSESEALGSG
jgi:hypothetical protein